MTDLAVACQVCGELPTQYARAWPQRTQNGTMFLCGRCQRIPYLEPIMGNVCNAHFANDSTMADKLTCGNCRAAEQAARDRIQADHAIDPTQPYGKHIVLTCKNHRDLFWTTKNIDHIGARSIFFASGRAGHTECSCPGSDLIVYKEDDK